MLYSWYLGRELKLQALNPLKTSLNDTMPALAGRVYLTDNKALLLQYCIICILSFSHMINNTSLSRKSTISQRYGAVVWIKQLTTSHRQY
jgi:hypothetical protein